MSLALFFAQHILNASTFIFRSLRLCVGILLWFVVCWRYGVVRLGWCGILIIYFHIYFYSHKLTNKNHVLLQFSSNHFRPTTELHFGQSDYRMHPTQT